MKNKAAIAMNCYRSFPFESALEGIRNAGFRCVDLTSSERLNDPVNVNRSDAELEKVRMCLKDYDLAPLALSGHTNLFNEDAVRNILKPKIAIAGFFGCSVVNTFVGEPESDMQNDNDVVRNLEMILPELEKYEISLCLEIHGKYARGADLLRFTDRISSPYIKINYDTANCIFYGGVDPEKDIPSCIGSVGYLHVKDKAGKREEWNFPALGEGTVNLEAVFSLLRAEGRPIPFSVEIEFTPAGPASLEEVNAAAATSFRYLSEHAF